MPKSLAAFLARELDPADPARVKLLVTDLHCKVVDQCLQFFGGKSYRLEYPIIARDLFGRR